MNSPILVSIWISPLFLIVLLFLYFRYANYSTLYGWITIGAYITHQIFCLIVLIPFLGLGSLMLTLLVGPFLVLDFIVRWKKRGTENPNRSINMVLLALICINTIFVGAALFVFFRGYGLF